jgi:hypothetical protein
VKERFRLCDQFHFGVQNNVHRTENNKKRRRGIHNFPSRTQIIVKATGILEYLSMSTFDPLIYIYVFSKMIPKILELLCLHNRFLSTKGSSLSTGLGLLIDRSSKVMKI